jgi:isopentenyl-diphosphate delta-isomerase
MTEEQVVLVSPEGQEIGLMGKQEAHEKGLLHKAFSVIVFNDAGEMLIQQRAQSKYHWAGISSNTFCSHPRKQESFEQAAHRRLEEELGFDTELKEAFSFIYKATDAPSGLTEHELDHVFVGTYNGPVDFNPSEVQAVRWVKVPDLLAEIEAQPEQFSFWFKIILKEMQQRNWLS